MLYAIHNFSKYVHIMFKVRIFLLHPDTKSLCPSVSTQLRMQKEFANRLICREHSQYFCMNRNTTYVQYVACTSVLLTQHSTPKCITVTFCISQN